MQMGEVEDIEFFHDGLSMCVWTNIFDNTDVFFCVLIRGCRYALFFAG